MARVSIMPVETLEMVFPDGTVKKALFNNEAFIIYTNEFGKIDDEVLRQLKDKPYDFVSKILYCGMKVLDKSITLEEAEMITVSGGEPLAVKIMDLVIDNFMVTADENSKKKFLQEMERINKQLMG